MQSARIAFMLGIVLLIAAAARADKITTDYDHSVSFYKYKTFMWVQEPDPPAPFMKERIVASINAQLRARGLRQVSDGADLAIGANVATEERHTWETYYTDSGWGWGWSGGSGWATTTEKTYLVGTLTVDLFDADSKKLVWQGIATDRVHRKPEKQSRDNEKAIAKMFREFPPSLRESAGRELLRASHQRLEFF